MVRHGLVVLSVLAAACGPRAGRGGNGAAAAPPSIPVAPLTLHTMASPDRGLVLGVGGPGRAAPVALALEPQPVRVAGVTVTVRAATAGQIPPAPPPAPPPGPLWAWRVAAAERAAAALLALRPSDRVFAVQGAGAEPPTSATLAVAMLAALTGATLDPRAAVLAELRPDGTLAPLADPAAELDRAIRGGARRLVLPLGNATAPAAKGPAIDLVKRAARAGAAASLSADLAQAYRALTGAAMPDAGEASPADLALAAEERGALEAAYRRHLARLAESWPRVVEQENRAGLPAPVAALFELAARAARAAERLRTAGAIAGATASIARAAAAADAAVRIDVAISLTQDGELAAARAALDAARAAAAAAVTAADARIGATPPAAGVRDELRTAALAADVAAAAAWSDEAAAAAPVAAVALTALEKTSREELTSRATRRAVADAIAPTLLAAARAQQRAESVADRAGLDSGGGAALGLDAAEVDDLVQRHRQAIAAGQALAEEPAQGAPRPPALVVGTRALAGVAAAAGRPPAALLGAAQRARDEIAAALSPGDGLAGGVDAVTGEPVRIARPERIESALVVARRAARQHAAAAGVAIGLVPPGARVAYQAAVDLAAGSSATEKLAALALYRAASAECRLAIDLAIMAARPTPTPTLNPTPTPDPTTAPPPPPSPSPSLPRPPAPAPPPAPSS